MMYAVILMVAFLLAVLVYRQGIKDGQRFAKGETIKDILPKMKPHTDKMSKEEKESQERMMRGVANILEYGQERK